MARSITTLALLILGGATLACDGDPTGVQPLRELPRPLSVAEQEVIHGSNGFALGLLGEVRALSPDSPNTFLSPLSASMALGMAMNGADGETWTQMRDVLGFGGMTEPEINGAYRDLIDLLLGLDPSVEIGLGNALWVDGVTLRPDFLERVRTHFGAEAASLDFDDPASADVMNHWVAEVTRDRIRTLVERVDPDALLYLINAIYFKADWRTTFDQGRTRPATFTRADGREVAVQMMADEVGYRVLWPDGPSGVTGVELPYGAGAFSAIALLPPAGQGIDPFVAGLDRSDWEGWMEHFDRQAEAEDLDREGVLVRLPKFELEWGVELDPALQALGMTDAFTGHVADFTRLTDDRDDLLIYDVMQKTYVKVDEKGTEAAAATSVTIGPTSAPPSLTFDRPFLFAIRERFSGTILFIGVIGDPSA